MFREVDGETGVDLIVSDGAERFAPRDHRHPGASDVEINDALFFGLPRYVVPDRSVETMEVVQPAQSVRGGTPLRTEVVAAIFDLPADLHTAPTIEVAVRAAHELDTTFAEDLECIEDLIDPAIQVGYRYRKDVPGWELVERITNGASTIQLPPEALAWQARVDDVAGRLSSWHSLTRVPTFDLGGNVQWGRLRDIQATTEEWAAGRRLPVINPNSDILPLLRAEGYKEVTDPVTGDVTCTPPTPAEIAQQFREQRLRAVELHNIRVQEELRERTTSTPTILADFDPADLVKELWADYKVVPGDPDYEFHTLQDHGMTTEEFIENVAYVALQLYIQRPVHAKEEYYTTTTIPPKGGVRKKIARYVSERFSTPSGDIVVWYERDRHESKADGPGRGDEPPADAFPYPVGINGKPVGRQVFRAAAALCAKHLKMQSQGSGKHAR